MTTTTTLRDSKYTSLDPIPGAHPPTCRRNGCHNTQAYPQQQEGLCISHLAVYAIFRAEIDTHGYMGRHCQICDDPLRSNRQVKYCSVECRKIATLRLQKARRDARR